MHLLVLEPYYGGSHKAVLDLLLRELDVTADVLTLPARKWKWRMRGAAITMAREARRLHDEGVSSALSGSSREARRWDLVFASTFVNLAEFYGLAGEAVAGVPSVVYFHENQFAYPNRHTAEWDFQFPLTNITSALTATRCVFNSEWTKQTFLDAIPAFLAAFPDHQPKGVAEEIEAKSEVLAPPFDPQPFDAARKSRGAGGTPRGERLRVVWPHRWEHDKDPDTFLRVVSGLVEEGLDFEVAIAGQSFRDVPESIASAVDSLGEHLVHSAQPRTREEYAKLLLSSDVAVSTARNEFFGLAMLEAAYSGCYPLVPDRLVYPEIYPEEFRYDSEEALSARLRSFVLEPPHPGRAADIAARFSIGHLAPEYARLFEEVAAGG